MSVIKNLLKLNLARDLNCLSNRMNLSCMMASNRLFSISSAVFNEDTPPESQPKETESQPKLLNIEAATYLKGARAHIGGHTKNLDATKADRPGALDLDALQAEQDEIMGEFRFFPDENTPTALFNGIKFSELPYVNIRMHKNNTKLIARTWDQKYIHHNTPALHGYPSAKKKTAVGGQVAGNMMGQKLRGYGHKYIRVRLNGFNQARDSVVKGITQAGINIVAIQDSTTVNWDWPQRAKRRQANWYVRNKKFFM